MTKRINLTKRSIAALKPAGERYTVSDTKVTGLQVRVNPNGSMAYYWYRKVAGRPRRVKIGDVTDTTPEQARKIATRHNAAMVDGKDPAEQKRTERGEPTLGELWEAFFRFVSARRKPKTVHDYQLLYNKHLKRWANRKLPSITRTDIAKLHATIGEDAPFVANRMLAVLSAMFARGHLVGHTGENPARGVERFTERSRDRYLTADELPRFMAALDADESSDARDFFTACLFTGARRGNVQRMRWADVDLNAATWTIPADDAKGGETMTIYLPDVVLDTLKRRKAERKGKPPYVFPGRRKGSHLTDPMPWWRRICKRAKLTDRKGKPTLRIHDLRRTLGSWQAAHGASLQVIGKSLGHRNQSTTAVYSRLDLSPIRVSVDTAVASMLNAARPNDKAIAGKIGKAG